MMRPFRFCVMGPGNIADRFVRSVRMLDEGAGGFDPVLPGGFPARQDGGVTVAAVASKSAQKASSFAASHGIAASYGSYEEMLVKERPDAVYISTVPASHAELAAMCLDHGVPVLCEKAMFTCGRDAEEILGRSERENVFVMEALWSRFLPANRTAKRWLDEGRIGRLISLEAAIGFAAPSDPESRYRSKSLGGGATTDILVYAYALADMMLPSRPEVRHVHAVFGETGVDVTDRVLLTAGGVTASLFASFDAPLEERLELIGTKGRIKLAHPHYADCAVLYGPDGREADRFGDAHESAGFVYEIAETIRCVRAGLTESPVVPHDLTRRCAALFDQVYAGRHPPAAPPLLLAD